MDRRTASGPNILVVEDDPMIAELVMLSLEQQGYRVTWAKSGVEALERIGEVGPALMLLDLGLPRVDGLSVLAELQRARAGERSPASPLPIIIMSGRDSAEDLRKAAALGATGHLPKPFPLPLLLSRVAEQIPEGVRQR